MDKVLILGATSAIAQAAARLWAARGARLLLVARDPRRLEANADDLRARGATVATHVADLADPGAHEALFAAAGAFLPAADIVVIAHGSLPDQRAAETDPALLQRTLEVNGTSVCLLAQQAANRMVAQGRGSIVIIGSVAGDRGRQSNYIYGAAKGLVARFAEGLRNRLHGTGVRVLLVKPGFVDTPMTAHLPNRSGPLWARPEAIAEGILRALRQGRDTVYLPGFWRLILLLIRHVPEKLFKRLSL